jgi:radical SAM protein with 4Fe4S-binding SPASM domain
MINILLKKINRYKLKKSFLKKEIISYGQPNFLIIESTNLCNLSCKMCPRELMKREKGIMDFKLFKKIIDETPMLEFAWLHFFGEPLLNDQLIKMINYAKTKCRKVKLALSTNSQLLNKNNFDQLVTSGLDFLIINLYEQQQQRTNIKLKSESEIEEFIKNRIINNLKLIIQKVDYCINNQEEEDREKFQQKWGKYYNVIPYIKFFHNWANQNDEIIKVKNINKYKINQKNVCIEPWRGFVICWNGDVVLCCNDYNSKIKLGNLRNQKINEIWNSKEMQLIREKFINCNYNNDLCRFCEIHENNFNKKINALNPYFWEAFAYNMIDEKNNKIINKY